MKAKSELLSTLNFYYKSKLSFFPLPYGEKNDATFKWGEFQKRRPRIGEVKKWFGNDAQHNVAIVCGSISGNLVVLDCDTEDRFYELASTICKKLEIDDFLDFTRVVKTGKGCHIYLFVNEPVQSHKFPKLDIKAEGGYVVAPPSLHPNGNHYEFLNPLVPIKHIDSLIDIGIDLKQRHKSVTKSVTGQDNWITKALLGVGEGDRNNTCFKLAGYFKNHHPVDITEKLLLEWNKKNTPPLDEREILLSIKSAYKNPPRDPTPGPHPTPGTPGPHPTPGPWVYSVNNAALDTKRHKSVTDSVTKSMAEVIEEWVKDSSGWFDYDEVDREVGIKTALDKHNRRMIFKRLKDAGIIEAHPKQNKLFRYLNVTVRLIDFKSALGHKSLSIKYPFGIEQYFKTYPGNIIVVAGAPDAGKTAFLLNLIYLNQHDYSIFYQSSEMGNEELANRLMNFENISLDEWNFTAEERSSNFTDIIRPDCVNIIDYMELSGEFYMVAEYLRQIYDKLSTGIAIVALQKDPKADQGRGGIFGLEKPRLYLNMDSNKITIRKAKNWTRPDVNPNRLELKFKIVAGCRFIVIEDWHKPADGFSKYQSAYQYKRGNR